MSEITCKFCFGKIKQEPNNDIRSQLSEVTSEQDLSITDNPVACYQCKVEVDAVDQLHPPLVKEEIKQEPIDDGIISDDCLLFNTDIPLIIEENTVVNIYYCYQCNYATNDKKKLSHHVFTHRLKCNWCSYTTPYNSSLVNHNEIHFIFIEGHSLDEHPTSNISAQVDINEDSFSAQSFICDEYDFKTTTNSYLQNHKVATLKKKQFNCNLCNYRSYFSQNLKIHLIKHTGERRPFTCDKCDYKTTTKSNLLRHKRIHSKEKRFNCTLCDYGSNHLKALKLHLMKHTGKRPFTCDKCGFKTTAKSNLLKHKLIHSKEKRFNCDLCGYRCNFSKDLDAHLRKHTGERPFTCNKCNYKTITKYNLQRHKIIHDKEKQFNCNLCDYRSHFSKHLETHLRKHSGERPFSCDECDFKTYFKNNLQRHKMTHAKEKRCHLCDYRSKDLTSHLQKHTGNQARGGMLVLNTPRNI